MPRFAAHQLLVVVALLGCFQSVAANPKSLIGAAVAEEAEIANATVTRELQTYSSTGFQTLMLTAVNKQRTANGLSKLCLNKKLQTAAQSHSTNIATKNYMSHTGSDGSSMSQRITAAGYKYLCRERRGRPDHGGRSHDGLDGLQWTPRQHPELQVQDVRLRLCVQVGYHVQTLLDAGLCLRKHRKLLVVDR